VLTNRRSLLKHALGSLTAGAVAVSLLWVPPAQAARPGPPPSIASVRHFQGDDFQKLRWSRVSGARSYQVFVKDARFDEKLSRNWRLYKTVVGTKSRIFVPSGHTRQFGVRAVGRPNGMRRAVSRIASFGAISRPAGLSTLTRVGRWRTVHKASLYRNTALEASRPGATLRLPNARASSSVRILGEVGPKFGIVDVYVGTTKLKRVDLGRRKHHALKRILVPVRPARSGTISLVARSHKPVRISAIGHTRPSTSATRRPRAPLSRPPARSFTLEGSGWGHGVGLSQYGAKAMGDAGKTVRRILGHYYSGTRIASVADDKVMDINVGYHVPSVTVRLRALSRGAVAEVCVIARKRCTKSVTIRDRRPGAGTAGEIRVTRRQGDVRARVTHRNGDYSWLRGSRIRVRWSGTRYLGGPASVVRMGNGREYRHGELLVTKHDKHLLNGIARLSLQSEYLRGIAEMPSSWNRNALRAQAIIARTYALKAGAQRGPICDCHLHDSVIDQAYVGWGKENEGRDAYYGRRWVNAVKSTNGRVLTYNGSLAGTYYFSSSGGHTLNAQDVWSSTVPYLRSVDDKWSLNGANPNRSWTTSRSAASMEALFGLPDIHKVTITKRYAGGAVHAVTATAVNGDTRTISGKADYMRSRLGLKSAWLTSIDELR
jgi:SpoIID/LytB domain protein